MQFLIGACDNLKRMHLARSGIIFFLFNMNSWSRSIFGQFYPNTNTGPSITNIFLEQTKRWISNKIVDIFSENNKQNTRDNVNLEWQKKM